MQPNVYICVIIVIFLVITYLTFLTPLGRHEVFINYFTILEGLTIVIVFIGLLISYNEQQQQTVQAQLQGLNKAIIEDFINVEKVFLQYLPYSDRLYWQMNQQLSNSGNKQKYTELPMFDPKSKEYDATAVVKRDRIEQLLALIVFAAVTDTYLTIVSMSSDWRNDPYVRPVIYRWIMWFRSEKLRQMWDRSKNIVNQYTRAFVDSEIIPLSLRYK